MKCEFCNLEKNDFKDLIYKSTYWMVFQSKQQLYLGRSIVVLNRHCGHLSALSKEEWDDLFEIIQKVESTYRKFLGATHFNWTCLMNNEYKKDSPDPHIHLHIRPRYAIEPKIEDTAYPDPNFGHHYLSQPERELPETDREKLLYRLQEAFKN